MDKELYDIASEHLQSAVALLPENADAHYNYATCLLKQNLAQTALYHLRQAVKLAPDNKIFSFRLAAVSGDSKPALPPTEYIQTLFDRYAERFDNDLLKKLNYQAPKLLSELLLQYLPNDNTATVIDLGCGTGLCGEHLQKIAGRLIGIDLSPAMLALAEKKTIYHELIAGDILTILTARKFTADAIIAADVLIYFGELYELLNLSLTQVNHYGWLAFSCEDGIDDGKFHLTVTGRYQHGRSYVTKLLAQIGWQLICDKAVNLREQQGNAVRGRMYLCQNTTRANDVSHKMSI